MHGHGLLTRSCCSTRLLALHAGSAHLHAHKVYTLPPLLRCSQTGAASTQASCYSLLSVDKRARASWRLLLLSTSLLLLLSTTNLFLLYTRVELVDATPVELVDACTVATGLLLTVVSSVRANRYFCPHQACCNSTPFLNACRCRCIAARAAHRNRRGAGGPGGTRR